LFGDQLGDFLFGIVQITEDPGSGRTDLNTGRLQACIDPVMAKVAFLDDRNKGVNVSRIVGTGSETIFAANAPMLVNNNNSVFPLPGGLNRTVDYAGRVVALIAEARKKVPRDVGVFPFFNNLDPGTEHS
jgi:hypothetical protein